MGPGRCEGPEEFQGRHLRGCRTLDLGLRRVQGLGQKRETEAVEVGETDLEPRRHEWEEVLARPMNSRPQEVDSRSGDGEGTIREVEGKSGACAVRKLNEGAFIPEVGVGSEED